MMILFDICDEILTAIFSISCDFILIMFTSKRVKISEIQSYIKPGTYLCSYLLYFNIVSPVKAEDKNIRPHLIS